jgi:hypothetical protein
MLFPLLIADASSWLDPNWWFDRVGILGVICAVLIGLIRVLLPDLRALIRSHVILADTLNVHVSKQSDSLGRVEGRQEKHSEQLAEIQAHLRPREAHR